MSDDSRLSAYSFYVEIDGIETARFQKCEGLEAETDVFEYEEGGGVVHKFKGRTRYPNLILEKGISDNDELFNWFKSVSTDGKIERKNGSVVLKNNQEEEIKRWNFYRALPCRWIGPKLDCLKTSSFAVEKIEIAHEGIDVDNDSIPMQNESFCFHIGQNMAESSNFVGDEDSNTSIGAINGYPETGRNSWRADNDQVFINACNNYNDKYDLSEGDEGYVSPKMLKAWAMVESGGSPDAFATDPLQVNNPGDWDNRKKDIAGISKNQEMTPEKSAEAALEWRRYKGYIHDETGAETEWRGDFQAFRRYNGNTNHPPASANTTRTQHRDYYADLVLELGSD